MLSNKLALAVVGIVVLVGAAGGGAFLAGRQTGTTSAEVAAPTHAAPGQAGAAVEATEAVMDDAAAPAEAEVSQPVAKPAPARATTARPAHVDRTSPAPAVATPRRRPQPPVAARDEGAVASVNGQDSRVAESEGRTSRRPDATTDESVPPLTLPDATSAREERRQVEPAALPAPRLEEVTIPADAVIGLQLENGVSSETSHVEDKVEARVTRDVRANGRVVVPAGSRVLGSVNVVERGGKMKERARLGVRFHTLILADGTEVALQTETIYREGDSPANSSATKVGGGAIGGAILGAILGGGKGAAIGGAVGAAGGTAAVMAGGRRPAQIQAGSPVTVKVLSPVTVTVEQ